MGPATPVHECVARVQELGSIQGVDTKKRQNYLSSFVHIDDIIITNDLIETEWVYDILDNKSILKA